jgi:hypothetical protein
MTTLNAGQFAGIMAEGKNKEFLEQIKLQEVPEGEYKTIDNGYSLQGANVQFDKIYKDISEHFGNATRKQNRGDFTDGESIDHQF